MERHRYKKLRVYQISMALASDICILAQNIESQRFSEQLISSAISIPSNIAEGADRASVKEFMRFLNYAAGSCAELNTQLVILESLKEIDPNSIQPHLNTISELQPAIWALYHKLRTQSR